VNRMGAGLDMGSAFFLVEQAEVAQKKTPLTVESEMSGG